MRNVTAAIVASGLILAACSSSNSAPDGLESPDESATSDQVDDTTSVETSAPPPPGPALVYVSVSGENKVEILELGVEGTLASVGSVDVPGPAGAIVHSPKRNELVVGTGAGFSTLELGDPTAPTVVTTTAVEGEPVYFDLAGSEDEYLLSAYFGEDDVRSHTVANGPESYERVADEPTAVEPHAIVVTADEKRAYVPQRNGESIAVYTIEPDGTLTATSSVDVDPNTGPRHLAFGSNEAFAYVINEHADSVSVFQVADGGELSAVQTVSTLPDGADGENNTGADIHVTPDGGFVYASNRGHDSIAMFAVNQDGTLAPLGHVETQARPRDFGVSPDGRFVVVAGQDSGQVETYRIGEDGQLTTIGVTAVGDGPVWVTII